MEGLSGQDKTNKKSTIKEENSQVQEAQNKIVMLYLFLPVLFIIWNTPSQTGNFTSNDFSA